MRRIRPVYSQISRYQRTNVHKVATTAYCSRFLGPCQAAQISLSPQVGTKVTRGPSTVVERSAETPFRNRTTRSLLLALCGGVSLACFVGLPGAPDGS